ncbi:MAG TPA: hypothetical protein VGJ10_09175 [Paraburkholderia sp.]|jgi:hypothetical protein
MEASFLFRVMAMKFAFGGWSIGVEFACGDWFVAHCVYGAAVFVAQAGETRCLQLLFV